jgi:VanZ family protein
VAGYIKSRLFWWYWFPVIVYCAAIFVQSAFPSPDSLSSFPFGDKVMHFMAYALMSVLFFRALEKTWPLWRITWHALSSVVFTAFYGVTDELHQSFVASRMAEGMDILADFSGGAFGALFFVLVRIFLKRPDGDVSN